MSNQQDEGFPSGVSILLFLFTGFAIWVSGNGLFGAIAFPVVGIVTGILFHAFRTSNNLQDFRLTYGFFAILLMIGAVFFQSFCKTVMSWHADSYNTMEWIAACGLVAYPVRVICGSIGLFASAIFD